MKCLKKSDDDSSTYYSDDEESITTRKRRCLYKCIKWTLITMLIISILLFIIIFVVLPLIVTFSLAVQTFLMFPNIDQPKNPEYNNFAKYGAKATRNFYVSVEDYYETTKEISLGIWHLVPEALIKEAENDDFDYGDSLKNSGYPVIIYFHGNSGTRIYPLKTYLVLRKYFHVLAFDYRSYGDSTEATLSENAVVSDGVKLYKWLLENTNSPIYVWGHSLGTALSTHTVANLNDLGIVPMGLFLEAAFTSMKEEIPYHPIGKIFAWLPWFDVTIVNPLQNSGFLFNTKTNILKVNSPIMIMHAEDDPIIPVEFGYKLSQIATNKRNPANQGNVTYYQFPAYLRYNHVDITLDPKLPGYIDKFVKYCKEFNSENRG